MKLFITNFKDYLIIHGYIALQRKKETCGVEFEVNCHFKQGALLQFY